MLKSFREQRTRKTRMAELERLISDAENADYGFGDSEEERDADSREIYEATRFYENELDYLRQAHLTRAAQQRAIAIPSDKWDSNDDWRMHSILTADGEVWVRRELNKYRDSRIEFWAKLVLPVASLILSVIALLKKH